MALTKCDFCDILQAIGTLRFDVTNKKIVLQVKILKNLQDI